MVCLCAIENREPFTYSFKKKKWFLFVCFCLLFIYFLFIFLFITKNDVLRLSFGTCRRVTSFRLTYFRFTLIFVHAPER